MKILVFKYIETAGGWKQDAFTLIRLLAAMPLKGPISGPP